MLALQQKAPPTLHIPPKWTSASPTPLARFLAKLCLVRRRSGVQSPSTTSSPFWLASTET